jgi:hypothetical protein
MLFGELCLLSLCISEQWHQRNVRAEFSGAFSTIAIMNEEPIGMIRWDRFAKLLPCPCRRWVIGDIGTYQFSRFNLHDYKHIEKLECRCNQGQKITGNS